MAPLTRFTRMTAPSGQQFEVGQNGYRAVVTESGGALRLLERDGVALIDGFAEDAVSPGGRGQLLMPWTNRIRDGRYTVDGKDLQLPLTEPARGNASHGFARWAAWSLVDLTDEAVELGLRVMAQSGYPWLLDLSVRYALDEDGLTVEQSAVNRSTTPAPYACGAHPYLSAGPGPIDSWELSTSVDQRLLVDDRLLPVSEEATVGSAYDFREPRMIGSTRFDDAFRVAGVAQVTLQDPSSGRRVELWGDESVRWLQLFSADEVPGTSRRSLAVEPMTAPADAFNSGTDLLWLVPGERHTMRWGVRASGQ